MNQLDRENIHYADLVDIAKAIRRREVSPIDLTEHMLERIGDLDPRLHAYARSIPDQARSLAHKATLALESGDSRIGPLHGVPIAVKANYYTKGLVCANGQSIHAQFVPSYDATVVRKLKDAGAILLGNLQMTEAAFGEHHSTITTPVNPWGDQLWSGASSSGSGVATAAGLCFASLGTDTGGSIRFPAAVNGVTGVKPTWGRVSRYGVFPASASLDHIGPIARSAADTALMLNVIAGADANDLTCSAEEVPDFLACSAGAGPQLRIGVDPAYTTVDVDVATARGFAQAMDALRDLGSLLTPVTVPDVKHVNEGWMAFSAVEAAAAHASTYPHQKADYGPALSGYLDFGQQTTASDFQRTLIHRLEFRGALETLFKTVDLLAMPVMVDAGLTVARMKTLGADMVDVLRHIRFAAPYNMSGHPTITLPCGHTEGGAPIGFQLVAPLMREDLLFRAAIAFQKATNWHRVHPKL